MVKTPKEEEESVTTIYPSKRYQKRDEFIKNWDKMYDKQWDVICKWHFQNKMKMYGSIQLDSLIKADEMAQSNDNRYQMFLDNKLSYMQQFVCKLLQY